MHWVAGVGEKSPLPKDAIGGNSVGSLFHIYGEANLTPALPFSVAHFASHTLSRPIQSFHPLIQSRVGQSRIVGVAGEYV